MNKVAAITERAITFFQKDKACLGFVFAVCLLVLLEFLEAVGELALLLIRTISVFDEAFAQLRFYFVIAALLAHAWGLLCGDGMAHLFGNGQVGGFTGRSERVAMGGRGLLGEGLEHQSLNNKINNLPPLYSR
jgi:hypothetical protein